MSAELAYRLMAQLLKNGEKAGVGQRTRAVALTSAPLKPYHTSRSVREREAFEGVVQAASDAGAVTIVRERGYADGQIERVELQDLEQLAAFLGCQTQATLIEQARQRAGGAMGHPGIAEVFEAWHELKLVRGTGPADIKLWIDAATVIDHMRGRFDALDGELPVREVSARLLKDSKRIERLVPQLDVLLTGTIDNPPRESVEVLAEIGLGREEHPVRLAGKVMVRRSRVDAWLDEPYGAFPAVSVQALVSPVEAILTIENQTTFHSEARRLSDTPILLIYTGGMPSPAWRAMFGRLIASTAVETPLRHWGDIDEGGYRIAANLAEVATEYGRRIEPYRMYPQDVPLGARKPANDCTVARMQRFAERAGWTAISDEIARARYIVEQEALTPGEAPASQGPEHGGSRVPTP